MPITTAARSKSVMMAVMIGTALAASPTTASAATSEPNPRAVQDISRYCQACWRNARLPVDRWQDCTQEVFIRLLERVETGKWETVLADNETAERREFIRAIDAAKKRIQRARKFTGLSPDVPEEPNRNEKLRDDWAALEKAAAEVLSPRQRHILDLTAAGWSIPEIAEELQAPVARISDEKYKAIKKMQHYFSV